MHTPFDEANPVPPPGGIGAQLERARAGLDRVHVQALDSEGAAE